jgi:hypothetical protein
MIYKNNLLNITLLICLSFFISSYALAENSCSWDKPETQTVQTPGFQGSMITQIISVCPNGKTGGTSCAGTKKTDALCCCNPIAELPAEPKFKLPDFQVKIPGLAALSKPTCVINEVGLRTCGISWISEYIFAIYTYGLTIVGVIAVLILMAAGLLWLVSGGDSTKINKAKEMILGSITGLLLMVSVNLLLSYINPDLIKQKTLVLAYVEDIEPVSNEGNPTDSKDCQNCVVISGEPATKSSAVGKNLNSDLLNKLKKANSDSKNSGGKYFVITEAYPPTSQHKSKCHQNGMCADIAIRPQGGVSCKDINNLIAKLQQAGVKVLNEYVSCNGTKTQFTTGGHMHVQ